jgi:LPXTG-motif cell wall-anchored protein
MSTLLGRPELGQEEERGMRVMVKRVVVLAVAIVGLTALPAAAQQYPPNENLITVSNTTPCPGQSVTIAAQTFTPGGAVTVKLGDSVVGTPTADASGKISLQATVPSSQKLGTVTVTATGPGSDDQPSLTVTASIDVTACNATPPPTAPSAGGTSGSPLPRTGSDSTMTLVRVGVALAAAGGVLLAIASKRRRRTSTAPAS